MTGAMNYTLADVYPGIGAYTSRDLSQPEAEDHMALVDNEKVAADNPVVETSGKPIWGTLIVIACFAYLLGR